MVIDDSLNKIATDVKICRLCGLFRARTNAVPGEGSSLLKAVLIGEAPGKSEDQQGRPFVGKAGKILDYILQDTGINRSQIFITNVVKCRPPGNRLPTVDEVSACKRYLDREFAYLKPKIIGLLGRTAYSTFIGGKSFSSDRGRILKKNGLTYLITFHPAAAIYNRSLIETLKCDFTRISSEIGC